MTGHRLHMQATGEGDVSWSIECLHVHPFEDSDRPYVVPSCTTWTATPGCICDCAGCQAGEHGDCTQDGVEEIGRQWCECRPAGFCFYTHVLDSAGADMLNLADWFNASWPVEVSGNSWDDPLDVSLLQGGDGL
jgi:hypothetical protein